MTASDLTPELLEAGRARAEAAGVELDWVAASAAHLAFDDGARGSGVRAGRAGSRTRRSG